MNAVFAGSDSHQSFSELVESLIEIELKSTSVHIAALLVAQFQQLLDREYLDDTFDMGFVAVVIVNDVIAEQHCSLVIGSVRQCMAKVVGIEIKLAITTENDMLTDYRDQTREAFREVGGPNDIRVLVKHKEVGGSGDEGRCSRHLAITMYIATTVIISPF
jgi:hypothetical protein